MSSTDHIHTIEALYALALEKTAYDTYTKAGMPKHLESLPAAMIVAALAPLLGHPVPDNDVYAFDPDEILAHITRRKELEARLAAYERGEVPE